MSKKTIKDIDLKGKKVLVRCDFNVPMDEERNITDNTRIVAALPTIKYLLENNALDLLKQLYEDPNLWVRLAAAIVMAPWDEINAFNIVKGIKEMDVDMYSFAAKYTLLNWKELSSSNKKCDL